MRIARFSSILVAALFAASPAFAQAPPAGGGGGGGGDGPPRLPFTITSTAFADGDTVPIEYTQANPTAARGEGTSPQLDWINVPEGTQSFVLHMHDPEVARNGTTEDQVHWLVWNIPGDATGLPEGVPRGATLENGAFQISATGPVYRGPGAGAAGNPHHYTFELLALDTTLDVQPGEDAFVTRTAVMEALQGHILGKTILVGMFKRPAE